MIKLVQLAPNFHVMRVGDKTAAYFSYETLVAFEAEGHGYILSGDWSTTTAKHLGVCRREFRQQLLYMHDGCNPEAFEQLANIVFNTDR